MDRFTKLLENGSIVVDCNICDQNQRTCHPLYCRHRLIQRLAEYEGTGLEPDEIDTVTSRRRMTMTASEWRKRHKKCKFCVHCVYRHLPPCCPSYFWCNAKMTIVNEEVPRIFCNVFKPKEV